MNQSTSDARFICTSPFVVKNFDKIQRILLSRSSKNSKKEKCQIILETIFDYEQQISQNIIQICDELYLVKNRQESSRILLKNSILVISKRNPQQAIDLIYTVNKNLINEDVLEIALTLHFENDDLESAYLLLEFLKFPSKFSSIRESLEQRNQNTQSANYIIEYKTSKLLQKIRNGPLKDRQIEDEESMIHSILSSPRILKEHSSLILRLSKKDLEKKYQKSFFGWAWAIFESLALTITFLILFEILSTNTSNYIALNIMIGIIAWSGFSSMVNQGTNSFVANSGLIKKLQMPKELFLLNIGLTTLFTMGLNMIAIIPLMIFYKIPIDINLILFPLCALSIVFYAYSITLFTSVTFAKWRDLGRIVNLILRIGFYFTPVFFTLEMMISSRLPEGFLDLYLILNPMAILLTILRFSITGDLSGLSRIHIFWCIINMMLTYMIAAIWFNSKKDNGVKYL